MITVLTGFFNTINNSKFLSTVVSTIIIILGLCLITYIIKLLGNIRAYITNKSNSYYLANQKNTKKDGSTLSMPDRIELTNSVLDLISFMVNNEIMDEMKSYITLNTIYTMSNLDTDAEKIAKKVYDGLKKNLFIDPDLLLTDTYLSAFIAKKTISTLMDVTQQHNANIRGLSAED